MKKSYKDYSNRDIEYVRVFCPGALIQYVSVQPRVQWRPFCKQEITPNCPKEIVAELRVLTQIELVKTGGGGGLSITSREEEKTTSRNENENISLDVIEDSESEDDEAFQHMNAGTKMRPSMMTERMTSMLHLIDRSQARNEQQLLAYSTQFTGKNKVSFHNLFASPSWSPLCAKAFQIHRTTTVNMEWPELMSKYIPRKEDPRYYDVPRSLKLIQKLLEFHDWDQKEFLEDLRDVLYKRKTKVNTFCIQGVSNAGKTYLLSGLRHIARYYGEIHAGDSNAFQFQNAINTNLIVIDEPCFTIESLEVAKLVLSGEDTHVKIKGKQDAMLYRTPVLITTNHPVYKWNASEKETILNRMKIRYAKKPCPKLKFCTKGINPAAWIQLLRELDENDEHQLFEDSAEWSTIKKKFDISDNDTSNEVHEEEPIDDDELLTIPDTFSPRATSTPKKRKLSEMSVDEEEELGQPLQLDTTEENLQADSQPEEDKTDGKEYHIRYQTQTETPQEVKDYFAAKKAKITCPGCKIDSPSQKDHLYGCINMDDSTDQIKDALTETPNNTKDETDFSITIAKNININSDQQVQEEFRAIMDGNYSQSTQPFTPKMKSALKTPEAPKKKTAKKELRNLTKEFDDC